MVALFALSITHLDDIGGQDGTSHDGKRHSISDGGLVVHGVSGSLRGGIRRRRGCKGD